MLWLQRSFADKRTFAEIVLRFHCTHAIGKSTSRRQELGPELYGNIDKAAAGKIGDEGSSQECRVDSISAFDARLKNENHV
jgi:hypothetical protein